MITHQYMALMMRMSYAHIHFNYSMIHPIIAATAFLSNISVAKRNNRSKLVNMY